MKDMTDEKYRDQFVLITRPDEPCELVLPLGVSKRWVIPVKHPTIFKGKLYQTGEVITIEPEVTEVQS